MKNKKVLLGMSGGVDSSAAAILLKNEGYEVIGATMRLWEDEENNKIKSCGNKYSATEDAKKVCSLLNIPHYTLNYEEEFKKYVIEDFIKCYKCAKTPNPCVRCNKYIKFNYFYKKALELGCDYIATGHYAKIEYSLKHERYVLKKSKSEKKDQTYFLYNIPKEITEHILFPLAEYEDKLQIRKIVEEKGLQIAKKPDSQEICFIPNNNYIEFLLKNISDKPEKGSITLRSGEILGEHEGLINYTIGQRKGLGITYNEPLYVIDMNPKTNEVIVGTEDELYSKNLIATDLNWIAIDILKGPIHAKAKIRYKAKESSCIITPQGIDKVQVEFDEPQRAITPGQSVVFYLDDIVLGGGTISDL